jgi:hypothetical protein
MKSKQKFNTKVLLYLVSWSTDLRAIRFESYTDKLNNIKLHVTHRDQFVSIQMNRFYTTAYMRIVQQTQNYAASLSCLE